MEKKMFCLFAVAVMLLCVKAAIIESDELTNIPPYLMECYQNPSLYDRQNRLPMTIQSLIEIIWTIEQYPQTSMDMQSLALSLLHMFRVDAIENDPEAILSDVTVPFKLSGYQLDKYQLLMKYLIPKSNYLFPNASLTSVQKCSLHFMLSSSVEKKARGDEPTVCQVVNRYQRLKREVPQEPLEAEVTNIVLTTPDGQNLTHLENASIVTNATAESSLLNSTSESKVPVPHEEIPSSENVPLSSSNADEDIEVIAPKLHDSLKQEKKGDLQQIPDSSCPVENGVIYTKWGSVSAGAVLAGIATGLSQQSVSTQQFPVKSQGDTNLQVNNQWAATLAGDLAEVAVRQGPRKMEDVSVDVGAKGGWNSTKVPRWYFIERADFVEMTDAEIRGGLDGLIMSTYVKKWNGMANNQLRLSDLLERYYSSRGVFDSQYQACKRQDLFTSVAPTNTMNEQAYSFATRLADMSRDAVQITKTGIKQFTEKAISKLNNYVASLTTTCEQTSTFVEPNVDLLVVIDCAWPFDEINEIILPIRQQIKASIRSNFTVVSSMEFESLMNSTNMTMNMSDYASCKQGMNLKLLLEDYLKTYYRIYLQRERDLSMAGTYATVVLFIPYNWAPTSSEIEAAQNALKYYRISLPDVTFLYLMSGNADSVQLLVSDKSRDIYTYTDRKTVDVSALVTRLHQTHRRITNPACGPDLTAAGYNTLQFRDVVDNQGISYYRVSPKYLYSTGSASIKIRGDYGPLKVCHSRRTNLLNNATSGAESECTTTKGASGEVTVNLDGACNGYEYVLQCPPLYISIQPVDTKPNYQCTTDKLCRSADDVMYTITHTGLACGGVGHLSASPLALTLGVLLMAVTKTFYISS